MLKGTSMEDNMAGETEQKPYTKPEIIYELDLETRAGTPLSPISPFDPAGGSDS
jgi:hypothetical protein